MASDNGKYTAAKETAPLEIRIVSITTTKLSVGTVALTKLGVVLDKMLEFTRVHRNAHVVVKDALLRAVPEDAK